MWKKKSGPAHFKVIFHYFLMATEVNRLQLKAVSVLSFSGKIRDNSMGSAAVRSRPVARWMLLVVTLSA